MIVYRDAVDVSIFLDILNLDGSPKDNVAHNTSDFFITVQRESNTPDTLTLNNSLTELDDSHVDEAFIHRGSQSYRLDLPDIFGGTPRWVDVWGEIPGGVVVPRRIDILTLPSSSPQVGNFQFNFNIPGSDVVNSTGNNRLFVKEKGKSFIGTANTSLEGKSLTVLFEGPDRADVFVFNTEDNGDVLTINGNTLTLELPDDFTEVERQLTWAVRNTDNQHFYGSGSISVVYAPFEDTI